MHSLKHLCSMKYMAYMSDTSMKMMEDEEDSSNVSDASMKMIEEGCGQINQKPRRYSAPSAYKSDNVNLLQNEMKYHAKRHAQPWDNDLSKVPKMNESHLSPHIYEATVNQGYIYDLSNSSPTKCSLTLRDSCVLHPPEILMDTTTDVFGDEILPEYFNEEQKLSAQKIAVGI